ncbi:UDP-glycosyltransferase 82A1 [Andrographis paniculata]|uniref:UDP-glycosyltransferase 82A1 n=1 Tax=Andrographis paniculata TaxID=175694 RepID=UPI0021885985|nr:UDP-glycosyltransferase 82A1 [Andrographis paniculata]QDA11335.1 UDP-glycosyltransferase [Andrographis paniculata]
MIKRKKIILVPYPAQGHVTPILKLAAVLSNLSFRPVIVVPEFIQRRISPRIDAGIICLPISDGLPEDAPRDFFAVERAMEENMPPALESIIRAEEDGQIACLVADLLASWSIDVARRCGVPAAGFWPAMHATYRLIAAVPQLIQTGLISENGLPRNPNAPIKLSSMDPIFSTNDLPWLIGSLSSRIRRFRFWTRTLHRAESLRCILVNSFPLESPSNINPMQQVLEIGPIIMQPATVANATFWEEDFTCLDWLDEHDVGSVVYVSFGSWVGPIDDGKIKTLALTLEALGLSFVWVLGHAWRRGLPLGYAARVATHGKIVSWAPQTEVLQHPAVGFYICHCGWNSTMEAILCKKPLLCYPIAGDQFLNCRYIVDVWKIGVHIKGFDFEEVKNGIEWIVENDEVSTRIEKLNEKIFGNDGSFKAMSNFSTFVEDINM